MSRMARPRSVPSGRIRALPLAELQARYDRLCRRQARAGGLAALLASQGQSGPLERPCAAPGARAAGQGAGDRRQSERRDGFSGLMGYHRFP